MAVAAPTGWIWRSSTSSPSIPKLLLRADTAEAAVVAVPAGGSGRPLPPPPSPPSFSRSGGGGINAPASGSDGGDGRGVSGGVDLAVLYPLLLHPKASPVAVAVASVLPRADPAEVAVAVFPAGGSGDPLPPSPQHPKLLRGGSGGGDDVGGSCGQIRLDSCCDNDRRLILSVVD
uniref:Uncharacterized protein n=1 Tax=Oryza punctata TaxID=4537 RepID=A0A0E0M0U3_ORYPU